MSHAQPAPQSSQLAQAPAADAQSHQQPVMQPTRDPGATLPDLLEVLLNKGVHLNLDLIISVADIPLIGVNLRATIAGIETMLEYGMMRQWDEQTRAWVQKSLSRQVAMAEGEELLAAMAASHYQAEFHRTWRPGRAYLTTKRLIVHRRDPAETLWQTRLDSIAAIEPFQETSVGGETRTRVTIVLKDGTEAKISAADPEQLVKLTRRQLKEPQVTETAADRGHASGPIMAGGMWYLETLSNWETWRGGRAVLQGPLNGPESDPAELTWKSPMDSRASVRIAPSEVRSMDTEQHSNPTDHAQVLRIETQHSTVRLASPQLAEWHQHLTDWFDPSKEVADGATSE